MEFVVNMQLINEWKDMRELPFDSKQGQKIYIKIYMDFMLNIYTISTVWTQYSLSSSTQQ